MPANCSLASQPIELAKYFRGKSLQWGIPIDSEQFAARLDDEDPLASFRNFFCFPKKRDLPSSGYPNDGPRREDEEEECIYLCGQSMGLKPKSLDLYVQGVLDNWANRAVHSHFHGYLPAALSDLPPKEPMARLVGARPHEIAIMNGLTVNLHVLLSSFYRPTQERHKIIIEDHAFCSDMYVVKSQITLHGFSPEKSLITLKPRTGEHIMREEDILEVIEREGDSVQLILLPGVQYYSGQLLDMATLTRAAHKKGIVVGADLAHAAGNVPLFLHDWDIDFAAWCTYKYLNSGAGCIAAIFVHDKFFADKESLEDSSPCMNSLHVRPSTIPNAGTSTFPMLRGWWGNDLKSKFIMKSEFEPMMGADMFKLSNPPPVLNAMLMASLDIFNQTSMEELRKKQILLTGYLEYLIKLYFSKPSSLSGDSSSDSAYSSSSTESLNCEPYVEIITPSEPKRRGAQLSLVFSVPLGTVQQQLQKRGVVCDIRMPSVLRAAPVPLYNSYMDVYKFVRVLREIFNELDGKFSYVGVGEPSSAVIDSCPGSPSSSSSSSLINGTDSIESLSPTVERMSVNYDVERPIESCSSSEPSSSVQMHTSSDSEFDPF